MNMRKTFVNEPLMLWKVRAKAKILGILGPTFVVARSDEEARNVALAVWNEQGDFTEDKVEFLWFSTTIAHDFIDGVSLVVPENLVVSRDLLSEEGGDADSSEMA